MGKLPTARNSSICTNHTKANINLQQIDGYQPVGQGQWGEARALFQRFCKYTFNRLSKHRPRTRNASLKIFAFHVVTNETWIHLKWLLRSRDSSSLNILSINTFTAIVDLSRFNNPCLKSPASTLVDLTFQSRTLRSFSLNQLRNLSL